MNPSETDDVTVSAQARVGQVLRGKYRLDKVLGVGGMAVVYKATHRNDAEFAVKMLHPQLSIREDVRTRFLREGKAANSVKHPGVVLVVDDDIAEDGAAFLVMELLDGAEVETVWHRSGERLPLRAVLSIATQLLDVLAAAHAKGVVHRDVKPANLFATRDGTLKVLDFGIARVKDAALGPGGGANATGTGVLLGTPAFMAPEQALARTHEIDGQTDVWAVGATIFTLLTGRTVHEGDNGAQLLIRAATALVRPISSLLADLPGPIAAVVDRSLAYEKQARWPDAASMREALDQASMQVFGEPTSKAAVMEIVSGQAQYPGAAVPPASALAAKVGPTPAQQPMSSWLAASATPVQRDITAATNLGEKSSRKGMLMIAALLAAGVAGLTVFGLWKMHAGDPAAVVVTPTPQAVDTVKPVAVEPAPAPATSHPVVAVAAAIETPEEPRKNDTAVANSRTLHPGTVTPHPTKPGTVVEEPRRPAAPTPTAAPAGVPSPAATAAPVCTFVKDYDADGQPHFKKVCK